jgi:nitroreductase
MDIIDCYKWRYATKKFNPDKKIPISDIEIIKESIRLAPTSYGLQLFKVILIENKIKKEALRKYSYNQSQVSDASHLFIFCNSTKVFEKDIDSYIENKSLSQKIPIEKNKGYGDFLKKTLLNKSSEEISKWTKNQLYIALTHLMSACASLKIDSCPIEGFDTLKYNDFLDINKKSLSAGVVAAIGYRSDTDNSQYDKKVRKATKDIFEID